MIGRECGSLPDINSDSYPTPTHHHRPTHVNVVLNKTRTLLLDVDCSVSIGS